MIELRSVTKRFGDFEAVKGVDLAVRTGEFLTLLGPSGCGKTTLLRIMAGFETPDEGSVWLGGEDISLVPPYRRPVNQVFQSYALFPHMTVRDNIAFGLRMQRVSRTESSSRVAEVMEMVSLVGLEDRRPHQLSGGQRQRVALARAIVCRPKVLLLDEPLSALDAKLRLAMQVELKRLQRRLGLTFVFVTHDQEEALTMSDRIAIVHQGRIEQMGSPTEIYHQPRTAFAADFVGMGNLLDAEVIAIDSEHARVRVSGGLEWLIDAEELPPGARTARVSVRPEKIFISKQPVDAEAVFTARVEEEIFKGPMDELWLRTPQGLRLTALVANESTMLEAIHEGDEVFCGVHSEDVIVVDAR